MSSQNKQSGGATPETRAWVARQRELAAAADADRARAADLQALNDRRLSGQRQNPAPLILALAVLALLLFCGWYIIGQMQCDPFYADHAGTRGGACR